VDLHEDVTVVLLKEEEILLEVGPQETLEEIPENATMTEELLANLLEFLLATFQPALTSQLIETSKTFSKSMGKCCVLILRMVMGLWNLLALMLCARLVNEKMEPSSIVTKLEFNSPLPLKE